MNILKSRSYFALKLKNAMKSILHYDIFMTNKHISPQNVMTSAKKKKKTNFPYYNPRKNKYLYVMVFIVLPLICTDLNANGCIIAMRIWKCYESEYVLMRFSTKIHTSFGF